VSKRSPGEWSRYWAYPADGVELLRARYVAHRYDPHIHETYAFGLVEGGRQTFACRGERFYSTGGSIFAINPGDAHDGAPADESGFVYRMIYVDAAAVSAHLHDASGDVSLPLFRTPMFFDARIARLLAAAHDAFAERGPAIEREHHLGVFLRGLARHSSDTPTAQASSPALARVRDYMHAHYRQDVSLSALAGIAACGRHHLTRSFTRAYGIAPHRYLTHLRLREAQRQLRAGHAIADIAAAVGFADQSHLHRRFKRAFGITPRQFQVAVTNVQ
jgi:AraC-like DNA-binding protein